MVKSLDTRIRLTPKAQRELIDSTCKKLNCLSLKKLAELSNISYSALKGYHQERLLIPSSLFFKLCKLSGIKTDSYTILEILPHNWGAIKGGKIGIAVLMNKYKDKMPLWRSKGKKHSNQLRTKKIIIPQLNEKLAEFIGAYLGDGTITPYFIRICGDPRYDIPYFEYLSKLVYDIFGIKTSIYKQKNRNLVYLLISSKKVCTFLNKKFKIAYGNKKINETIIPNQILNNKKFKIACLRGLVDTDGSVSRRGREGSQFCVQFTSNNKKLLKQVYNISKKLRVFTYLSGNETGTNSWVNVIKYFKIVGSSNLKHIIRFYVRYKGKKTLYLHEVLQYYERYKNYTLPFKLDGLVV